MERSTSGLGCIVESVIVVALIVFIAVAGINMLDDSLKNQPVAEADHSEGEAVEAVVAVVATEAAIPTATPVPPTNTPMPTETPVPPTATPVPPTSTPEPTEAPTEEVVEEPAGSEEDALAAAVAAASVSNGEMLFQTNACIGCHTVDSSETVMVGPGQYNLINRAGTRIEGMGAYTYIYNSIVNPNDFVVEGFAPMLMPQNYGDILSDDQIYDIIAYLASLSD